MAASHSIGTAPALNGVTAFTSCTRSMPRFASVYCTFADAYTAALYVAGPVAGMNTSWMPAGTTGFAAELSPLGSGVWTVGAGDRAWDVGGWEVGPFSLLTSRRPSGPRRY